jgi:hypothetical protein
MRTYLKFDIINNEPLVVIPDSIGNPFVSSLSGCPLTTCGHDNESEFNLEIGSRKERNYLSLPSSEQYFLF